MGEVSLCVTNSRLSFLYSSLYSRISLGWQCSSRHKALSVEKRMARHLPVFIIERLAGVIWMRSASSVSEILRRAIIVSSFTIIAIVVQKIDKYSLTANEISKKIAILQIFTRFLPIAKYNTKCPISPIFGRRGCDIL